MILGVARRHQVPLVTSACMAVPFGVEEWVVLAYPHTGVAAGTSVRVSKLYRSPREVEVTCALSASGESRSFDVPVAKLAPRKGQRKSLRGRLRTKPLNPNKP